MPFQVKSRLEVLGEDRLHHLLRARMALKERQVLGEDPPELVLGQLHVGSLLLRYRRSAPRTRPRNVRRVRSLRMRCAALCPDAAITPPPGWVPAPHR